MKKSYKQGERLNEKDEENVSKISNENSIESKE